MKHWDIIISKKNWIAFEATIDIITDKKVYVTPRGKLSLNIPERIILDKADVLLKKDNKAVIKLTDIKSAYEDIYWIKMPKTDMKTVTRKEWDTVTTVNWPMIYIGKQNWSVIVADNRNWFYMLSDEEEKALNPKLKDIVFSMYKLVETEYTIE